MPFLAILRHDLRSLWQSWLVRLWLAASALLTLLLVLTEWREFPIAPLIGSLLVPYLVFPWFLVVMVLGVNPVSGSRADSLADGFLSRPITRHEYLLAVWASRVVLVLSAYLVVIVPAVACVTLAKRPAATDTVTIYGVIAALAVVGLVLIFQVSLSFLFGTLLRKPLLAIVILLFLWYPANILMSAFKMEAALAAQFGAGDARAVAPAVEQSGANSRFCDYGRARRAVSRPGGGIPQCSFRSPAAQTGQGRFFCRCGL